MIYLVWAMTEDRVIGNNNELPWNIKSEMQYFRQVIKNKTILLGSKTLLSIGKPLKFCKNIIISNNPNKYKYFLSENCIINNDLDFIIAKYQKNYEKDIYVIGGANIYYQTFPFADFLYVSIIKKKYHGNIKFPINDFTDFKKISSTDHQEFIADIYQRKD